MVEFLLRMVQTDSPLNIHAPRLEQAVLCVLSQCLMHTGYTGQVWDWYVWPPRAKLGGSLCPLPKDLTPLGSHLASLLRAPPLRFQTDLSA
jgi:hypothetical protein